MTSAFVAAINILTKPLDEASGRDAQSSQQEALQVALQNNRRLFLQQLQSASGFEEVRRRREEVMEAGAAVWFSADPEDATWAFVQESLLLLLALSRHLNHQLLLFNRISPPAAKLRTPEAAPPLPPDVLSVAQQKTLRAALQFVVSLGLCPYLAPGVGIPLGRRSAFGAVVEKLVGGVEAAARSRRLLATTCVLLQLAELSSLATLLFTQHLGDVMAALCQLGFQPRRPGDTEVDVSAEERQSCREALRSILGKVYQPMVVKQLLLLQGGATQPGAAGGASGSGSGAAPAWLRRRCGQLLSERLMKPNGVQAVVRAILEGGSGGESDWRKCEAVARILVACPQQCDSADSYYRQVCPQILDLLHFKDKLTALQFQRVTTRAVLSMVQEKPSFAHQYLLSPLLQPLHRCSSSVSESAVVEEWELTRCVEDVFKICVVGNSPSAPLLKALEEVLPVLFSLFCFTKKNVSHLRTPCQDILLWYLSAAEAPPALAALRRLAALQEETSCSLLFSPGSDGGVRLESRQSCTDEDDALYEKLSEEQWRLECLSALMAQLKDSDLPGDFFLELLQDLTSWTSAADEERTEEELDISSMTLLQVEQEVVGSEARRSHTLVLLQVLAVMVETLPHHVLLRKNTQVVDFILSLLQRACVGLDQDPRPGLDQDPRPAPQNPIESQTLSMAMGLVATILSGPELSVDDFSSLSRLLRPLETLSHRHWDPLVQELASNLRTVLATHGAYRPQNLPAAAAAAAPPPQASTSSQTSKDKRKFKMETKGSGTSPGPGESSGDRGPSSGVSRKPGPGGAKTSGAGVSYPSNKPLSDWLLEACDPEVPSRALALRVLTQMVQRREPEVVQAQDKVLLLFLENLEHEDSFVYLSAIQGLAALADSYPERIMERLLKDFQHGPSPPCCDAQRSLETRLKVGEVLMRASRAMGDLAPHCGRPLLAVFLRGTRDSDPSVRASCLSNLGELCQRMDYSLGPLAQELSSCLTALIKTEKEAEVRRAAVHVIALLLRGLSNKTTQVLADVLLDLYRALKWVLRSDPDRVTVLHAQLALEELDQVTRSFIFPEQKLEKKIVVLP